VSTYQWLLFFHLLSAFAFFGGAVAAGILQLGATARERPSEIAAILRLARVSALVVGVGALGTLVFGMALVGEVEGYDMSDTWLAVSLALWVVAMVLGGLGGRTARHAREHAQRLAGGGDVPSAELRAQVAHRPSLYASYASLAILVVIVLLMVWRPS
jgi:uncharacterized membrane protein